mgnify:CR=1 FL=1
MTSSYPNKTVSFADLIADRDLQLDLVGAAIRVDATSGEDTVSISGEVATVGIADTSVTFNFIGVEAPLSLDTDDLEEGDAATVTFTDYGKL